MKQTATDFGLDHEYSFLGDCHYEVTKSIASAPVSGHQRLLVAHHTTLHRNVAHSDSV